MFQAKSSCSRRLRFSLFGVIGAVIGVPISAAIQIVVDELTAKRRARNHRDQLGKPDARSCRRRQHGMSLGAERLLRSPL